MRSTNILSVLLIALLLLMSFSEIAAIKPGRSFEEASRNPIDVSVGMILITNNITESGGHYYRLEGLRTGMKLTVKITLTAIKSAYYIVSLHSSDYARLTGYDGILGYKNVKEIKLEYVIARIPIRENTTLYLKVSQSGGAVSYKAEISTEPVSDIYPTNPEGDAGDSAATALKAPEIMPNKTSSWTGYLSSTTTGEDYEDYYQLKAKLSKGDKLAILIQPSKDLRLEASLLSADLFPLKTNQSELRGKPVIIKLSGEWEDKPYTFYLKISNFGGTGGEGTYTVKAWIEKAETSIVQTSTTTTEFPIRESMIRFGIIIAAIALIVISILVLLLRRRAYRVEEVSWWGETYDIY